MTGQSENERNKAGGGRAFQGGSPGSPHELRAISASRLHRNRARLPSLGPIRRGRVLDHLLPSVTDVFAFARFSYEHHEVLMALHIKSGSLTPCRLRRLSPSPGGEYDHSFCW